jgi:hypothetical protein
MKVILNSNDRIDTSTSANDCQFNFDWASALEEGRYNVTYSICSQLKTNPIPTFQQVLLSNPPWARYDVSSFNQTTQILSDLTGNSRNAICSGAFIATQINAINGSSVRLTSIVGPPTATIQFPVGSLPPVHTLCFITRYRGTIANQKRILVNDTGGYFGHFAASRGSCFFGNQIISNGVTTTPVINYLNMIVNSAAQAPNNVIVNGVPNGNLGVPAVAPFSSRLAINLGTTEVSGWELCQLIIFDRSLSDVEMYVVSTSFDNYLATGILI